MIQLNFHIAVSTFGILTRRDFSDLISIILCVIYVLAVVPRQNSDSGALRKKKGANLENCKAKARSAAQAAVSRIYGDQ